MPESINKEHPEFTCQKCGNENTVWYAPNHIWNKVNPLFGIICPVCFLKMADEIGLNLIFTVEETNKDKLYTENQLINALKLQKAADYQVAGDLLIGQQKIGDTLDYLGNENVLSIEIVDSFLRGWGIE